MNLRWPYARRLLVIRLDASGDLLMCTPALHALSKAGYEITLLTSTAGSLVSTRIDAVCQTYIFDSPWMKASGTASGQSTREMAKRLREQSFDGAVIMHSYS